MKTFYFLLLIAIAPVWIRPIQAERLDDVLLIAGHENPRIKSAYQSYLAALERLPQVGALPDPQLTLGVFLKPMQQMMGNQVAQVSLMQMLPWFGALDAAKEEASWEAKARFESFANTKSQVFYDVKVVWYALHLVEAETDLTEQTIAIMETLEAIGVSGFKSGATGGQAVSSAVANPQMGMNGMDGGNKSGLVDVLRIQMERLVLENRLALLRDNRALLQSKLNGLLDRPLDTAFVLSDSLEARVLPVMLTEIPDTIVSQHPLLQMLKDKEQALLAQKNVRLKMGAPTVGVGIQYGILNAREGNANAMNGRDMVMPMVSIRIPLWRKKYSAAVEEVDLERSGLEAKSKETENDLLVSFEEKKRDLAQAARRRVLHEKQATLAQQALDILTAAYGAGGEDIEDVLRMQLRLLDFRLNAVQALVDHKVAVAMMERLMGR